MPPPVLAEAVGVPTENTAKWITEHRRLPERRQEIESYAARLSRAYSKRPAELHKQAAASSAAYARFNLLPGQLVIVDEASMAATRDLEYITAAAAQVGAKVLLVGDWAQLSPVLADTRRDAPARHDVRRFRNEWERAASLKLRAGRSSVAGAYADHGRVESGSREDMIDLIFDGWLTDVDSAHFRMIRPHPLTSLTSLTPCKRGLLWRAHDGDRQPDPEFTVRAAGPLLRDRSPRPDRRDSRRSSAK